LRSFPSFFSAKTYGGYTIVPNILSKTEKNKVGDHKEFG
jgi:hypothetical protein